MLTSLKEYRRILLRKLKLRPIDKVFKRLQEKGYKTFETGLEVFGYNGEYHTMNYQEFVKSLHVWELDANCEEPLKRNLPKANVKITDSYKEIKATDLKCDLVVVDNHQGTFGDGYCEHFEMLPQVFRVMKDEVVLLVNVLPNMNELKKRYGNDISTHIARRNAWYGKENTDVLSNEFLLDFYECFCKTNNFKVEFSFIQTRNKVVSYLVLGLKRDSQLK